MDEAARQGSDAVVRVLLENRTRFQAFLTRRLDSSDLAEEILQEAIIKALERGGEVRDGESIVAWFFRVLRNAVVDLHRRQGARARGLEQLARELETTASSEEATGEVCSCVSGVLATLRPEYQSPIQWPFDAPSGAAGEADAAPTAVR